jgi:glycosyltransferase involved in cell wall biosynthesis
VKPPDGALDIVFVGHLPPFTAGSAISSFQLMAGIAGRGHRVRALAAVTPETVDAADALDGHHDGVEIRRFLLPFIPLAAGKPPSEAFRALEREGIRELLTPCLAGEPPDVIVVGRELYVGHVAGIAQAQDIPCVLLARGHPTRPILDGTYPGDAACALLEDFRHVDLIITPARHLTAGLRRLGFDRVETVPNAVDLSRFTPMPRDGGLARELRIGADDTVVLHASNLTALKRPLEIVDAATRALRRNPRLVFVIVGDGPLRAPMEEACRRKDMADRFRFAGWVGYERMPRYINLADMVVLASETEGLARVYLETQACARTLVASDIPAAREVVTDGATGLLFGTGDTEGLAARILLAAADPALRATIGRQAREAVQAHSLDHAIPAYVALFEDVSRRHRALKDHTDSSQGPGSSRGPAGPSRGPLRARWEGRAPTTGEKR